MSGCEGDHTRDVVKKETDSNSSKITGQHHISEQTIHRGKWLALNQITYKDPYNTERSWECMHRTTKHAGCSDAVFVVAILRRLMKYDCLVLVKQYRPPVKAYTVEFPAGLLDEGEEPGTAALRELREETGYTGIAKHCSPPLCSDPGASDGTHNMVTVEIDGDDPTNIHPVPKLEFIEVLTVPLDELLERLNKYTAEGSLVQGMVYSYAISMEQTKSRQPNNAHKYGRTISTGK